jgi:uncharacterized OB-fold protein
MSTPQLPTGSGLPAGAPPVNLETRPFWDATAQGRFLLRRCNGCGFVIWYPRGLCPDCGSVDTEWFEASGRGMIYTFSITRRGQGRWRDASPYVLAYVELEEGPRVMTNIVAADPDSLRIGQPVEVTWDDTGEGTALYRFRPR